MDPYKSFLVKIISENCDLLQKYDNLRNDKKIILEVVKLNGQALYYVSEELKNDKEIVLEAVKQNEKTFIHASKKLKNDREIVLEAVKRNGYMLSHASDQLKNNKEIVMEAIKQNGCALNDASQELKNNKEIVIKAIQQNGHAICCASDKLKNDKEIVLEAVKQNGSSLIHASNELKNDKEIVLEAVKQYSYALNYASDELKSNKEFISKLANLTNDIFLLRFINKGRFTGKELNDLLPDTCSRKKIKSDMMMNGLEYKIGINKDINNFDTLQTCSKGGLYFSNEKYINRFNDDNYGSDIYEVKLPDDAQVYLEDWDKGKADMIEIVRKLN